MSSRCDQLEVGLRPGSRRCRGNYKFACISDPLRRRFRVRTWLALHQCPFPLAFGERDGRSEIINVDLTGGVHRAYFGQWSPIEGPFGHLRCRAARCVGCSATRRRS
jgi:hypothetical protein